MSRIKHFENLSEKDFNFFLDHISEFIVSEKIDGYNLLFGRDEKGFFTSRETRGGKRYYHEHEYPLNYATSYQRSAHKALEYHYSISGKNILHVGDLFEVEILYGKLPNVVLYDGHTNQCILLRKIAGLTEIHDLTWFNSKQVIGFQITIPIIAADLSKRLVSIEDTWCFEKVPISSVTPLPIDRTKSCIEIKEELLNQYVRNYKSHFGPELQAGGWIEGLVFSHKNLVVKLVDKECFTKIKNFTWQVRNSISERPVSVKTNGSLLGSMWIAMGTSLGDPLLGTTQCSRQLKKLGTSSQISANFSHYNFHSIATHWETLILETIKSLDGLLSEYCSKKDTYNLSLNINNCEKSFTYSGEIDYKTRQTFSEVREYLHDFLGQLEDASCIEDLLFAFIGKYILTLSSINIK
jgi:hypothetical protein